MAGRPSKSLAAHLRDGTFRPGRHAELLAGPPVTPAEPRRVQLAYQLAESPLERRRLLREFQEVARVYAETGSPELELVDSQSEADVAGFFRRYLTHTKGPMAGEPFVLEPWQEEFVRELYRRDSEGRRIYRLALLGLARGNGKSPLAAALGLYELVSRADSPDVICAAASRDQARIVFNFARDFVVTGELVERLKTGRNEIVSEANIGSMRVISADGPLQHGLSVSAAIVDELWAFGTGRQEELVTAMTTAMHKRTDSFTLAITTAGFDKTTILGRLYDEFHGTLELEHPRPGLTVGRDEESGTLLWWYGAAVDVDLDDEDAWRQVNPAGWLDLRDLRRQRSSPAVSEAAFRRLHLNQWTEGGEETWITAERWQACRDDVGIPAGATVVVGVDASYSGDATAVCWAYQLLDERVVVRTRVWSALRSTACDEFCPDGRIDFTRVEDFITTLADEHRIRAVRFDPSYFHRSAEILSDRGLALAPIIQSSNEMRDAYNTFYAAVNAGRVCHNGDPVLQSHVLSAVATVDERGWRIRKATQGKKIDALVAAVIAYAYAAQGASIYETRPVIAVGGEDDASPPATTARPAPRPGPAVVDVGDRPHHFVEEQCVYCAVDVDDPRADSPCARAA